MTAVHIPQPDRPPPMSPKHDNGYDRCPHDGCIEVDSMKEAHIGAKGMQQSRPIFVADRRLGGCGGPWARPTLAAVENDMARGINPIWKGRSAETRPYTSVPSDAFRDHFDHAFGKCGCPPGTKKCLQLEPIPL